MPTSDSTTIGGVQTDGVTDSATTTEVTATPVTDKSASVSQTQSATSIGVASAITSATDSTNTDVGSGAPVAVTPNTAVTGPGDIEFSFGSTEKRSYPSDWYGYWPLDKTTSPTGASWYTIRDIAGLYSSIGMAESESELDRLTDQSESGVFVLDGGTWDGEIIWGTRGYVDPDGIPDDENEFSFEAWGYFYAPTTGTYSFGLDGDDAVDLFVDETKVVQWYGGHGTSGDFSHNGTIDLDTGWHTFRARQVQGSGGQALAVAWQKPSDGSWIHFDPDTQNPYQSYEYGSFEYGSGVDRDAIVFDQSSGSTEGVELLRDTYADNTIQSGAYSLWFRSETTSGDGNSRIISRDASEYPTVILDQNDSNGQRVIPYFRSPNPGTIAYPNEHEWHHLVMTWDSSDGVAALYIDGEQQYSTSSFAPDQGSSGPTRPIVIAGNTEGDGDISGDGFTGRIDEVKVFDRSLSQDEARALYALSEHDEVDPQTSTVDGTVTAASSAIQTASVSTQTVTDVGIQLSAGASDRTGIGVTDTTAGVTKLDSTTSDAIANGVTQTGGTVNQPEQTAASPITGIPNTSIGLQTSTGTVHTSIVDIENAPSVSTSVSAGRTEQSSTDTKTPTLDLTTVPYLEDTVGISLTSTPGTITTDLSVLDTGSTTQQTGSVETQTNTSVPGVKVGRVELSGTIDEGVSRRIEFDESYSSPVVVSTVLTENDYESVDSRHQNVTSDGFDIFLHEPDEGSHPTETVGYIAVDADRALPAGIQAGTTTVSGRRNYVGITFDEAYDTRPVALQDLQSNNNSGFAVATQTSVDTTGLNIGQDNLETGDTLVDETAGWIAIEPGQHELGVPVECGTTANTVGGGGGDHTVSTNTTFSEPPTFVASMDTLDGGDGGYVKGNSNQTWNDSAFTIHIEEDQTNDSERGHATEKVSWLAIEPNPVSVTTGTGSSQTSTPTTSVVSAKSVLNTTSSSSPATTKLVQTPRVESSVSDGVQTSPETIVTDPSTPVSAATSQITVDPITDTVTGKTVTAQASDSIPSIYSSVTDISIRTTTSGSASTSSPTTSTLDSIQVTKSGSDSIVGNGLTNTTDQSIQTLSQTDTVTIDPATSKTDGVVVGTTTAVHTSSTFTTVIGHATPISPDATPVISTPETARTDTVSTTSASSSTLGSTEKPTTTDTVSSTIATVSSIDIEPFAETVSGSVSSALTTTESVDPITTATAGSVATSSTTTVTANGITSTVTARSVENSSLSPTTAIADTGTTSTPTTTGVSADTITTTAEQTGTSVVSSRSVAVAETQSVPGRADLSVVAETEHSSVGSTGGLADITVNGYQTDSSFTSVESTPSTETVAPAQLLQANSISTQVVGIVVVGGRVVSEIAEPIQSGAINSTTDDATVTSCVADSVVATGVTNTIETTSASVATTSTSTDSSDITAVSDVSGSVVDDVVATPNTSTIANGKESGDVATVIADGGTETTAPGVVGTGTASGRQTGAVTTVTDESRETSGQSVAVESKPETRVSVPGAATVSKTASVSSKAGIVTDSDTQPSATRDVIGPADLVAVGGIESCEVSSLTAIPKTDTTAGKTIAGDGLANTASPYTSTVAGGIEQSVGAGVVPILELDVIGETTGSVSVATIAAPFTETIDAARLTDLSSSDVVAVPYTETVDMSQPSLSTSETFSGPPDLVVPASDTSTLGQPEPVDPYTTTQAFDRANIVTSEVKIANGITRVTATVAPELSGTIAGITDPFTLTIDPSDITDVVASVFGAAITYSTAQGSRIGLQTAIRESDPFTSLTTDQSTTLSDVDSISVKPFTETIDVSDLAYGSFSIGRGRRVLSPGVRVLDIMNILPNTERSDIVGTQETEELTNTAKGEIVTTESSSERFTNIETDKTERTIGIESRKKKYVRVTDTSSTVQ